MSSVVAAMLLERHTSKSLTRRQMRKKARARAERSKSKLAPAAAEQQQQFVTVDDFKTEVAELKAELSKLTALFLAHIALQPTVSPLTSDHDDDSTADGAEVAVVRKSKKNQGKSKSEKKVDVEAEAAADVVVDAANADEAGADEAGADESMLSAESCEAGVPASDPC